MRWTWLVLLCAGCGVEDVWSGHWWALELDWRPAEAPPTSDVQCNYENWDLNQHHLLIERDAHGYRWGQWLGEAEEDELVVGTTYTQRYTDEDREAWVEQLFTLRLDGTGTHAYAHLEGPAGDLGTAYHCVVETELEAEWLAP